MIRWCIALHTKSSGAYEMIRESGFLSLPHSNTLRDYTSFTEKKTGFNAAVINRIKEDMCFDQVPAFQKNVSLIFDEVKIQQGLVYSSETGELVGFCDIGEINQEIEDLRNLDQDDLEPQVATHVIAFMVRGLFDPLHSVFGHFACLGFTSSQIYWSAWKGVAYLEKAGFHVRCMIADGTTPNRNSFRIHRLDNDGNGVVYYTHNIFRKGQKIFFICDPPHLIKTTRNNWENSGWHNKTRHMEVCNIKSG